MGKYRPGDASQRRINSVQDQIPLLKRVVLIGNTLQKIAAMALLVTVNFVFKSKMRVCVQWMVKNHLIVELKRAYGLVALGWSVMKHSSGDASQRKRNPAQDQIPSKQCGSEWKYAEDECCDGLICSDADDG